MARNGGIAGRLYRGEVSLNFVGRQRLWYAISGVIVLISAVALAVRSLNFSIEFKGGASFTLPSNSFTSQGEISRIISANGGGDSTVQQISEKLTHAWTAQTGTLSSATTQNIAAALAKAFHVSQNSIAVQL